MATHITTLAELQAMDDDLTEDYILDNDIDAADTENWNSGAGFSPISLTVGPDFSGSFDGGGHTISNLFINRPTTDSVGLFSETYTTSQIKNVFLEDVDITGKKYTGALIGDATKQGSNILSCGMSGDVTGNDYTGGLLGNANHSLTLSKCFSKGTIIGNNYTGGLVGNLGNTTDIDDCYNQASVSGADYVGGFAAVIGNGSTVDNIYSSGSVAATGSHVGGLFASRGTTTVSNSFWDTEASGQSSSAGGTGRTTSEMKAKLTYADVGWNFDSIWDICTTGGHALMSNLGRTIKLPRIPPQIKDERIKRYLIELDAAIRDFVARVYDDLHY